MGRHRLHPRQRRRHAAQRLADGVAGTQAFYAISLALFTVASFLCGTARSIWVLVFYRMVQGTRRRRAAADGAGNSFRDVSAGAPRRGDGDLRHGRDGRPGHWPGAGRLDRRQRELAADLLHQHTDRHRRVPDDARLHSKPEIHRETQGRHRLDRPRPAHDRAWRRCSSCSSRASATTGSQSQTIVILLTLVSVASLISFVVKSLRDRHPIVDLRVFKFRSFSVGSFLGIIMGFGLVRHRADLAALLSVAARLYGLRYRLGADAGRLCDRRLDAHHRTYPQPHRRPLVHRLRHAALRVVDVVAGRPHGAGGILGRLLAAIDSRLRARLFSSCRSRRSRSATCPFRRWRVRPASSRCLRQLGGSFGIAILTTMLTHETAIAWNVLASGVTQTHGYSVRPLTADRRPAVLDDRLRLSLPRDGDRLRPFDTARLSDQAAGPRPHRCSRVACGSRIT